MPEILAADIGGTHSRFAHFTFGAQRPLAMVQSRWLKTGRASSFPQLLDSLGATDFGLAPEESDIAVIAVAGPVVAQVFSHPPNIDWDIDLAREPLAKRFRRCLLINDFSAHAYACISPAGASARPILPGEADPGAALAVVGAGTGLGHAALLPLGDGRHQVVPSEGGHASFPFETPPEWEYARFLMREVGEAYVRSEIVVSGRGLSLVHRFLTGDDLKPADIGPRLTADSPTLAWMARFYGREARNYCLQVLARGGLYIAGGVAAKQPALVTHAAFAEEFRRSPTMSRVLDSLPVFLITEEESGLWGAARCGMQLLTGS